MNFDDDLAECFKNMFVETAKIQIKGYFTTSKNNRGIVVNNFQYYFKTESKNGDKRWVCNKTNCNASITTSPNDEIVKINGKFIIYAEPVESSHKHMSYDESEIRKLLVFENLKTKATNETGSVLKMFEDESASFVIQGLIVE